VTQGTLESDWIEGRAMNEPYRAVIPNIKAVEETFVLRVNECAQCGGDIIAPQWSECLSDYCIRNVWSCEACGYQFEDTVYLAARELAHAD
jgi:ribosomal protein L37AE/L43A